MNDLREKPAVHSPVRVIVFLLLFTVCLFLMYSADACALSSGKTKVSVGITENHNSNTAQPVYRLIEESDENTSTKYFYNEDGKLNKSITYRDNKPAQYCYYYYSPSGRLVERRVESALSGAVLFFHYDSRGTEIETGDTGGIGSQANAGPRFHAEETYDEEGRVMTFRVKPDDGEPRAPLLYEYDSKGRILSLSSDKMHIDYHYALDGSFTRIAVYQFRNGEKYDEYDTYGRLTKSFWIENGSPTSMINYQYDTDGNLIEVSRSDGSWQQSYSYEIDMHNNISARVQRNSNGSLSRTEYVYERVS